MKKIKQTSAIIKKQDESLASYVGGYVLDAYDSCVNAMRFIRETFASVGRLLRGRTDGRFVDWMHAMQDVGPSAVLIVSLISFLIGVILAFVGAAELQLFGAAVYVASLVAFASVRIMGAMMTGIIMAGRTGASYAATIGSMNVNQEIDALDVMQINKYDFLVLPRLITLVIAMPILTLLADFMAVAGGAFIGVLLMNIPWGEYVRYTTDALTWHSFIVGMIHSIVYAIITALCGCYYGITCPRSASGVGKSTTRAVVSSIVWMIVATGIITVTIEVFSL